MAASADVYMICQTPYNPVIPESLNYGAGNWVAALMTGDSRGNYFQQVGTHKILCFSGGAWTLRDDTNNNGCFFYLNGALASYNPQPGGVAEFRVSKIPNA